MNEQNRVQYIVRVIEVRADGEWPISTAEVTVDGTVSFREKDRHQNISRTFSAIYNVIQRLVRMMVADNLIAALTDAKVRTRADLTGEDQRG